MSRDKIKKVKKKFFSVINHTWDFLGHPCMPLKIDRIFSTTTPSSTSYGSLSSDASNFIYYDPIMEGK